MAKLQKYTFDLDFGAPNPAPEAQFDPFAEQPGVVQEEEEEDIPPPPPPMFSEDDLSLAREQAFEAGRAAGISEAEQFTERLMATTLQAVHTRLHEVAAAQAAATESTLREAAILAMAVVKKLQPELARLHALDEIEGVIHECLAQLDRDLRVTIRTNPVHLDGVRERAERAAAATAFEGKLVFTADPRVSSGDCRVEWGDGGAERDQARIWAEVDAIVLRALGIDPAQQQQHHDTAVPA